MHSDCVGNFFFFTSPSVFHPSQRPLTFLFASQFQATIQKFIRIRMKSLVSSLIYAGEYLWLKLIFVKEALSGF